jgi:four helix bundle protein
MMDKHELEQRTKKFAVDVIRFVGTFDRSAAARVIGYQLLRSGTSIGANYREANRAVSRRDFSHRVAITEKEASETHYWLEICLETSYGDPVVCADLLGEVDQLLAIFTAIGRSIRATDRHDSGTEGPHVAEPSPERYSQLNEIRGGISGLVPDGCWSDDE